MQKKFLKNSKFFIYRHCAAAAAPAGPGAASLLMASASASAAAVRDHIRLGQVGDGDQVVAHVAQAGQQLRERRHDEVVAVPEK